jgi:pseudouridine-5'-phosphate glycosidase
MRVHKGIVSMGLAMASATLLLCSAYAADDAKPKYTMPSQAKIKEIIEHPEQIAGVLENATDADVATLLITAIGIMENMSMPADEVAAKLNAILNEVSNIRGEAFGAAVMARLRKKVNPRLLPIIPPGDVSPPSSSSKYPRQSTT